MTCFCGADDCYRCHPEQFREVGNRRIYIGDLESQEAVDEALEEAGLDLIQRHEDDEDARRFNDE